MIDSKQIQAIIEDLEDKQNQLSIEGMENLPSSAMVPAIYEYVITELKGLILDESKN